VTPREAIEHLTAKGGDYVVWSMQQSDKYKAALAALRSAVEDQERIDWLQQQHGYTVYGEADVTEVAGAWDSRQEERAFTGEGPTFRTAVDAARTPGQGE
jgi:hypothetical protein